MKRLVTLYILIIMTFILLIGCSDDNKKDVNLNDKNIESSYNPFDLDDEQISTDAEFGFGPVNPVNELTYTGDPIEQEYYYDNTGDTDCKLGFMIFIDGVAQLYKINGENNQSIMHEFDVNKKSKTKFKVSFKPSIGKEGDKLGLYVATIFNPNYVPSASVPSFGNNRALSQVLPVDLKYLKSINNLELNTNDKYSTENITEEIKKEYLTVDEINSKKYVANEAPLFHLKYDGDFKNSKIELKNASKLSLRLEGLCGPDEGNYRTTIFIDNKPVKTVDGKKYLEMQLKKEMLSKQSFDVDISGLTGLHVLYTISVPKRNDYSKITNPIVQSPPKLLIIGE